LNDYLPTIQSDQLNNQLLDSILNGGNQQRTFAESWAIGKVRGMLDMYYDLDFEITDTLPFNSSKTYFAGSRVVIDFPLWVASSNSESEGDTGVLVYKIGQCVTWDATGNGLIIGYVCITENSDTSWNTAHWRAIGNQYDLFFIPYPCQVFSLDIKESKGIKTKGFYNVGDLVWWDNSIWQCLVQTTIFSQSVKEQYNALNQIPKPNQFPSNKTNQQQWKWICDYNSQANLSQSDSQNSNPTFYPGAIAVSGIQLDSYGNPILPIYTSWTLGDNRDPIMVQAIVDFSIWRLCSRIAPNNIPTLRQRNFEDTWDWLKAVQKGTQSIKCPSIQPNQVDDISFGSDVKKINHVW